LLNQDIVSKEDRIMVLERIRAIDKEIQKLKQEREIWSKKISQYDFEDKKQSSSDWIQDIYQ